MRNPVLLIRDSKEKDLLWRACVCVCACVALVVGGKA